MAHNDIKPLNDNDEKALISHKVHTKNFLLLIITRKNKSMSKMRKKKSEKFAVQKFKNCHFKCIILRYLVPINDTKGIIM